jgi:hypothetical protein
MSCCCHRLALSAVQTLLHSVLRQCPPHHAHFHQTVFCIASVCGLCTHGTASSVEFAKWHPLMSSQRQLRDRGHKSRSLHCTSPSHGGRHRFDLLSHRRQPAAAAKRCSKERERTLSSGEIEVQKGLRSFGRSVACLSDGGRQKSLARKGCCWGIRRRNLGREKRKKERRNLEQQHKDFCCRCK